MKKNHLKLSFSKVFTLAGCFFSASLLIWTTFRVLQPDCLAIEHKCSQLPLDLIPPFVSIGFWVVGLTTWIGNQPVRLVLFFFLSSGVISTGLLSGLEIPLAIKLFYILLAWLSPVLIKFHLEWSLRFQDRLEKAILMFFFLIAGIWSIPFIFLNISHLLKSDWFPILRLGIRSTIFLALVIAIILAIIQFRNSSEGAIRFRLRLVFFATILAFVPILLLSQLPNLFGLTFIPTEINMVWLLIIPLAYGYSIFYPKLSGVEVWANRICVYYLVIVLYVSGFLFLTEMLVKLVPEWRNNWAWISATIGISLFLLLTRLDKSIQHLINHMLYGRETTYLETISKMTESLGTILSREKLRRLLLDQIMALSPITSSALFLKTEEYTYTLEGVVGFDWPRKQGIKLECGILTGILSCAELLSENAVLHKKLPFSSLTPQECEFLALPGINYWIPLITAQELHGFLLVGCLQGEKYLNKANHQIWQIFAHQAGIAAHNVLLAEDVRASRNGLARAHQNLLDAHEQEKRQLSCELHDNALQQLIGITYQLTNIQQKVRRREIINNPDQTFLIAELDLLRQEILQVGCELRELIGELRPAGLEEFGISGALESFVDQLQRRGGSSIPQIILKIDINSKTLPEEIAICLYRITQEAIRNSLRYAHAHHLNLYLYYEENYVVLKIKDDGCGFRIPDHLNELSQADHFGLIGITERVTWINGQCEILSNPGKGTELIVRIPVNNNTK